MLKKLAAIILWAGLLTEAMMWSNNVLLSIDGKYFGYGLSDAWYWIVLVVTAVSILWLKEVSTKIDWMTVFKKKTYIKKEV